MASITTTIPLSGLARRLIRDKLLSQEFGVPLFDIDAMDMSLAPVSLVKEKLIRQHHALPLYRRGKHLFVAVSDPTNLQALDVEDASMGEMLNTDLDNLEISAGEDEVREEDADSGIDDAPVVRFINKVLLDAIKKGASDIHFERARGNMALLEDRLGEDTKRKIWAHRVGTLGSLQEARVVFDGVELDLVFHPDKDEFYVYHPPNPNIGLRLEEYLTVGGPELHFWFDWKNANEANLAQAFARLQALERSYRIKDRVIVETSLVAESVSRIRAGGWTLSYYLPTESVKACMADCAPAQQIALAVELIQRIKRGGFSAISFDVALLSFVQAHLAAHVREANLEVFYWNLPINASAEGFVDRVQVDLARMDADVMLVSFPSFFDI